MVLQRCNLPFWCQGPLKYILENYRICQKSGNDAYSRGWGMGGHFICIIMTHWILHWKEVMAQEIKRELSLQSFSTLKTNQGFYILNREKKLWKEKIFLNEDFSEDTASIRKDLLRKAKDLRSQNKVAKIVYDRLIVYEKKTGNDISEAQGDP